MSDAARGHGSKEIYRTCWSGNIKIFISAGFVRNLSARTIFIDGPFVSQRLFLSLVGVTVLREIDVQNSDRILCSDETAKNKLKPIV